MSILLGFLPFLVFAVLSLWQSSVIALVGGAVVSAGLLIRNHLQGGTPKILEGGTFVLLLALAVYAATARQELSIIAMRLCVDFGLFAIVVVSMAVRSPFSVQYAKEQVPEKYWSSQGFIRTNYAITAGWAAAFLVMVTAEAAMLLSPNLPKSLGAIVIAAALLGAVWFTKKRSQQSRTAA